MDSYKAEFDTRLLYRQNYTTEDSINVSTSVHAILWGLGGDQPPATSRARFTMLFNNETGGIQPIQGLIEQWKNDGWVILDEFVDLSMDLKSQQEFEDHLMKMLRSFLLGIPIEAELHNNDASIVKVVKTSEKSARIASLLKRNQTVKEEEKEQEADNLPEDDDSSEEELLETVNEIDSVSEDIEADSDEEESSDDDWM